MCGNSEERRNGKSVFVHLQIINWSELISTLIYLHTKRGCKEAETLNCLSNLMLFSDVAKII